MKLWVDDIRNAPDTSWTVARTVTSAINALARWPMDEISLDHDISHQIVMGNLSRPYRCEECFCSVARFIVQKEDGVFGQPKIVIHSANPEGASDIASILGASALKYEVRPMGAANRLEMEV